MKNGRVYLSRFRLYLELDRMIDVARRNQFRKILMTCVRTCKQYLSRYTILLSLLTAKVVLKWGHGSFQANSSGVLERNRRITSKKFYVFIYGLFRANNTTTEIKKRSSRPMRRACQKAQGFWCIHRRRQKKRCSEEDQYTTCNSEVLSQLNSFFFLNY